MKKEESSEFWKTHSLHTVAVVASNLIDNEINV